MWMEVSKYSAIFSGMLLLNVHKSLPEPCE